MRRSDREITDENVINSFIGKIELYFYFLHYRRQVLERTKQMSISNKSC